MGTNCRGCNRANGSRCLCAVIAAVIFGFWWKCVDFLFFFFLLLQTLHACVSTSESHTGPPEINQFTEIFFMQIYADWTLSNWLLWGEGVGFMFLNMQIKSQYSMFSCRLEICVVRSTEVRLFCFVSFFFFLLNWHNIILDQCNKFHDDWVFIYISFFSFSFSFSLWNIKVRAIILSRFQSLIKQKQDTCFFSWIHVTKKWHCCI